MQVTPGVYAIGAVGCAVYLLGGEELTLIDAGGPGSAPRILRALERLEREPRDLARVLLTHADLDHAGGLGELLAATGATVMAHPEALRRLAEAEVERGEQGLRSSLVAVRRLFARPEPVSVGEPLQDGMVLPILGGLEVIFTGGHSPDHVVYFLRQSRRLICGDLLQVMRGHLQPLTGPTPADHDAMVLALRRLAALDPLVVLPGHGPISRDNVGLRLYRLAEILE